MEAVVLCQMVMIKEKAITKKQMKYYKILVTILLSTLIIQFAKAQEGKNKIDCIQGVWRGVTMDIEPYTGLSNFFQIIRVDSIYSFYVDTDISFVSRYKFVNFDIQKEDVDFYDIRKENILSSNEESDESYLYTEIDNDGNIAVDKFFVCGEDFMTKLHFEFERQSFLPYSVYFYLKKQSEKEGHNYITEFDILNKLKKAEVTAEKAYFYSQPEENTKRKAFVLKGDKVIIDEIREQWIKVAYEGKTTTTQGWLKKSALEILE